MFANSLFGIFLWELALIIMFESSLWDLHLIISLRTLFVNSLWSWKLSLVIIYENFLLDISFDIICSQFSLEDIFDNHPGKRSLRTLCQSSASDIYLRVSLNTIFENSLWTFFWKRSLGNIAFFGHYLWSNSSRTIFNNSRLANSPSERSLETIVENYLWRLSVPSLFETTVGNLLC